MGPSFADDDDYSNSDFGGFDLDELVVGAGAG